MSDDTISRQAAITTAVRAAIDWHKLANPQHSIAYCIGEAMRELPSAQPELNEWCHDCKEYDKKRHCCPRWNRVIKTALADAQPEITEQQIAEYCRKRNLVLITHESYAMLIKAYYDRRNSV